MTIHTTHVTQTTHLAYIFPLSVLGLVHVERDSKKVCHHPLSNPTLHQPRRTSPLSHHWPVTHLHFHRDGPWLSHSLSRGGSVVAPVDCRRGTSRCPSPPTAHATSRPSHISRPWPLPRFSPSFPFPFFSKSCQYLILSSVCFSFPLFLFFICIP